MADRIEPNLGSDTDIIEELPSGTRIKQRNSNGSEILPSDDVDMVAASSEPKAAVIIKTPKRKVPTKKAKKAKKAKKSSKVDKAPKTENIDVDNNVDTHNIASFEKEDKVTAPGGIGADQDVDAISRAILDAIPDIKGSAKRLYEHEKTLSESMIDYTKEKDSQIRKDRIIALSAISSIAVSIIFFVVAIMTFSAKNNEFDALSGALVKRIVEMNSGLTSFEEAKLALSMMQAQIEGISLELEKNQQIYLKSEEDIQSHLVDYSQEINGELISQTANLRENFVRLEGRFSVLNSKILDVEQVLESSQSTLSQVGAEARSLGEMKEVMDALLLLERERYFEVISGMSNDQSEAIPIANQVPGPAFTRTQ